MSSEFKDLKGASSINFTMVNSLKPKAVNDEFSLRKSSSDDDQITDLSQYLADSKTHFENAWRKKKKTKSSVNDFETIKELGRGTFGHVYLVQRKKDYSYHAMKVLSKADIAKRKQEEHTINEKKILRGVQFPFIVHLEYCFKDDTNIYFVMPFIAGGEMFCLLHKEDKFDEGTARFYASQVVLALEYLHYLDLVYRDLKPENILIDHEGYLKLTDFGFCKYVPERTWTVCGTPQYIAPEIILLKGYGKSVDWWSFGVLLYEMAAGYTPFHSFDVLKMYEKITEGKYSKPRHFSTDLNNLITNLLQVDITRRYGNLKNGVDDIKLHRWFENYDWMAILNRKILPDYVPNINDIIINL